MRRIKLSLCFSRLIHYRTAKMGSMEKANNVGAYAIVQPAASSGIPPDIVVDLRSDTVTQPSDAMRKAMACAVVGDDVFREDATVNELEMRVARILGKSAGLYVSSGTMGNLLACLVHCNERGSEMIVGDQAHIFYYEQGNYSQFGGIHSNQIPNKPDGTFCIEGVKSRIRDHDIHCTKTKMICVENTHNRCGGKVLPLNWLDEIAKVAKMHNIALHMDGARVFNAAVVSNVPVSRIVRDFNSVSVCFSKSLGAPAGSVLVGDANFIENARRLRKALGGGMRQSGILAAACLYCLDNRVDRLKDDNENAKIMASIINEMKSPHVFVNYDDLETNIMMLNIQGIDVVEFCERLATVEEREKIEIGHLTSVKCNPFSKLKTRLVTHADVSQQMAVQAARKICFVTLEFAEKSKHALTI